MSLPSDNQLLPVTYADLIAKVENPKDINYEDLLKTTEWRTRRQNIIQRDKYCCTNCGLSESVNYKDYFVSFRINEITPIVNIHYDEIPLDTFKAYKNIKNIFPFRRNRHTETYCGISNDGTLFLFEPELIKDRSRKDIVINRAITQDQIEYFAIGKKGAIWNFSECYLPFKLDKQKIMHVHHVYYIYENLPWEYEDDQLTTMCDSCHSEYHKHVKVKMYTRANGELKELNYTPCLRCNGAGHFHSFRHIQGGICFRCKGERFEELIKYIKEE